MTLFNQATVALSMTETDAEILQYVSLIAGFGICQRFHFIHAIAPLQDQSEQSLETVRGELETLVTRHVALSDQEFQPSYQVGHGVRIDSLIALATEVQSDLIILGHRKCRSGQRSLARRLALVGPMAVWMVPEGSPLQITSILAPVDFSDHSAESLAMATAVARRVGLNHCLSVHVAFDPLTIRYDERVEEFIGKEMEQFDHFLAPIETQGVEVRPIVEESSNVSAAILRVAQRNNTDLLVMNTRGRSRAAAILLGSATSQTMTECQVPILVVKNHGAHMSVLEALRESNFWRNPNMKTN